MKLFDKLADESASKKAYRGLAKLLAVIIILSVAVFGDVMYFIQMQKIFKGNGLLMAFCLIGACTSVLAISYLMLGKSTVFEPGGQMIASWVVFVMELAIITLNILVVFEPASMGMWATISPATPVAHMLGIAIVFFLDPELREAHHQKEMESKQRKAESEFEDLKKTARLAVQRQHLQYTVRELETAINSPESQARIAQHAQTMNDGLLTEMSGHSIPTTVDSDIYDSRSERGFGRR